jgi:hypothetical protein
MHIETVHNSLHSINAKSAGTYLTRRVLLNRHGKAVIILSSFLVVNEPVKQMSKKVFQKNIFNLFRNALKDLS